MMREVWVVVPSVLFPALLSPAKLGCPRPCRIWRYHVQDHTAMARTFEWFSSVEEAEVKCAVAGAEFKKFSLAAHYDHVFLRKFEHNSLSWREIEAQFAIS